MLAKTTKLTPYDTVQIFKEYGTIITLEEVELLLDFLYKFGRLMLHNIFNDKAGI